jgi:hypothetical protein
MGIQNINRNKFTKFGTPFSIDYNDSGNSAERLSSAMNCVGAERAAWSTIRDNAVHSL